MLLTKKVAVVVSGNVNYYKNLGYKIPTYKNKWNEVVVKRGTKIIVKAEDLPKNSTTRVNYMCNKCKKIINTSYSNYVKSNKNLCSSCTGFIMGKLSKKTTKMFIQKAQKVHRDFYDYSKVNYKGAKSKLTIICSEHGEFSQVADYHLQACGCPMCKISKNELKIIEIFKNNNIKFNWQKTFKTCINPNSGYNLIYDFLILDTNTLLEYDGIFHFQKIHKNHNLKDQQYKDELKNKWAKTNNYKLVRISYKEDIEERLHEAQII